MGLYVISVGGSLIVPEEIDVRFLKNFKDFIIKRIEKGDRFILIAGGGKICRKYQSACVEVSEISDYEKDELGIEVTRLNAFLLKNIFKGFVNSVVVKNPVEEVVDFQESILIGAGWKPGCSTDYDAVLFAKRFDSKNIINLSNIDYIYDSDPKVNFDAKKIEKISWDDFKKIVGDEWNPGLSAPFDPIASKEASEFGISVAIINGNNFKALEDYLDGKEFKGSLIK